MDHKSESPNLSFNYPKLRLRRRVGLFNLSLGHFGFCNPRIFKSWYYLNALHVCADHDTLIFYNKNINITFQNSKVLYDVKEIQDLRDTNAKQEKRIEALESLHNLGENDYAK